MEPQEADPNEVEGVLNPAAMRGKDDQLYLFPRLVARGNYSRIGMARVLFDRAGEPRDVERMGIALEPEADYEFSANGGGCEDPRITYVEPLRQYVMTYTAASRHGPRIAIAVSDDLFHWRRQGLAIFRPFPGLPFDSVDDKDASISLIPISDTFKICFLPRTSYCVSFLLPSGSVTSLLIIPLLLVYVALVAAPSASTLFTIRSFTSNVVLDIGIPVDVLSNVLPAPIGSVTG